MAGIDLLALQIAQSLLSPFQADAFSTCALAKIPSTLIKPLLGAVTCILFCFGVWYCCMIGDPEVLRQYLFVSISTFVVNYIYPAPFRPRSDSTNYMLHIYLILLHSCLESGYFLFGVWYISTNWFARFTMHSLLIMSVVRHLRIQCSNCDHLQIERLENIKRFPCVLCGGCANKSEYCVNCLEEVAEIDGLMVSRKMLLDYLLPEGMSHSENWSDWNVAIGRSSCGNIKWIIVKRLGKVYISAVTTCPTSVKAIVTVNSRKQEFKVCSARIVNGEWVISLGNDVGSVDVLEAWIKIKRGDPNGLPAFEN